MIGFAAGKDLRFACETAEGTCLHYAFAITLKTGCADFRRLVPFALQERTFLRTTHTAGAEVVTGIN